MNRRAMMSDVIQPCPFCGHVGLSFGEGSTFRWLAYSCAGCGIGSEVRMQTLGDGDPADWRKAAESRAIAEWGRRTDATEIARLRAEVEAMRANDARYRWLRDGEWECFADRWLVDCDVYGQGPDDLDAAIDLAEAATHA